MSLEYVLLGLLRQPASGYDLKAIFDQQIHYFWAAELSQIYPTLQKLEKRGWLRSRAADSRRGPMRRVYEITGPGRRALRRWLQSPPEIGVERNAFLAQLYFLSELADLQQTRKFFQHLREQLSNRLTGLEMLERLWRQADPAYPDGLPSADFHIYLALSKGLHSLRAHVAWCDHALNAIDSRSARETKAGVTRKPARPPGRKP